MTGTVSITPSGLLLARGPIDFEDSKSIKVTVAAKKGELEARRYNYLIYLFNWNQFEMKIES